MNTKGSISLPDYTFHGTTTIGERGQVVVPLAARGELNLAIGEKLLVFTLNKDTVVLTRLEGISRFIKEVDGKLSELQRLTHNTIQTKTGTHDGEPA